MSDVLCSTVCDMEQCCRAGMCERYTQGEAADICVFRLGLSRYFFCDTGFGPRENDCTLRIQSINSIEVRALYAS